MREAGGQHDAGDGEPGQRPGPEVADDRGVDEHVERLGDEGPERRHGEPQDLAVVRAAAGAGRAAGRRRGRTG